jgi:PLP dependent protein
MPAKTKSSTWVTTISTCPPSSANDEVAARLAVVQQRIVEAGGDPGRVRIIAVTKGFGVDAVQAARAVGLAEVGENYAAELESKAPGPPGTHWHFLGAIQRNKVKALAPLVDLWQGVARPVEGEQIARYAPGARVLIQVDTSGRPGRNGCPPDQVSALATSLATLDLRLEGLMTVAPQGRSEAAAAFETVGALADELGLAERSMGMTDDLEAAVAAGSTMVRVGRALFGERPAKGR